ncbi:MAG: TlpA family protein disulfide reductase [Candidatus Hodarchaeota archaeon]
MPRKRFSIPPNAEKERLTTQDEKIDEVLSSLDNIQTKQRQNSFDTPKNTSLTKIIGIGVIIIIVAFGAILSLENAPFQQDINSNDQVGGSISESLDFQIQLLDGSLVWLSDFSGSPIILDLFATNCQPCIDQIAIFQDVRTNYPSVQIISVSVNLNLDTIFTLTNFKETHDMDWVVGRDINHTASDIYSVNYIPTLVFFNTEGTRTQQHVGLTEYKTLAKWIGDD